MRDRSVLKGTGASRLAQAIRRIGYNDYDRIELATVTSAAPDLLRIKLDHISSFELDAGDVLVSECLTDHTGVIVRGDGSIETVTYKDGLKVGDRVIVSTMNNGQTWAVLDRMVNV